MKPKTAKTKKNSRENLTPKPTYSDSHDIGTIVRSITDSDFKLTGIIIEAPMTDHGDVRRVLWSSGVITIEWLDELGIIKPDEFE